MQNVWVLFIEERRMKISYLPSGLYLIFCCTILSIDLVPNPENTHIYFDVDEVVAQGSWTVPIIVYTGLKKAPLNSFNYIQSLLALDKMYQKDPNGLKELLYDKGGNAIEGATFHWLEHGRRDANLTQYVPDLLQATEYSRCFIPGTKKICHYLKKKGYEIHFATNKDHISYELMATSLGQKFTSIPSKVFVAHPGNHQYFLDDIKQFADQPTTHSSYKDLAHRALTVEGSDTIIHAQGRKPEESYYHCLLDNSKNKQFVFFIDDRESNVDGFNILQEKSAINLRGILFKNPTQLAHQLVLAGILSEDSDYKFLKKLGYEVGK